MAKTQKVKMKWYSPQALAERANDGFLFIARSVKETMRSIQSGTVERANDGFLSVARATGKVTRSIQSGTVDGVAAVERVFSRENKEEKSKRRSKPGRKEKKNRRRSEPVKKEKQSKRRSEPVKKEKKTRQASRSMKRKSLARDVSLETEKGLLGDEKLKQEGLQSLPPEIEELFKQHPPRGRLKAAKLRKALGDLLDGAETDRLSALKSLVELRQVAEPFLVACIQEAPLEVVEIALEGLKQIGSQRLRGCLYDILASPDPELRMVALRAAQRLTDDEVRLFLGRGARDPSTMVKRRVLSYLSWRDSSWALAEIKRLCRDPDSDMQWVALKALLAARPFEAHDVLELIIPLLEPAYRRRAIIMLERQNRLLSKDPMIQAPCSSNVLKFSPPDAEERTKKAKSPRRAKKVKGRVAQADSREISSALPLLAFPFISKLAEVFWGNINKFFVWRQSLK